MPYQHLAVIGDSILWGQGLIPEHKIHNIVWAARGNGSAPVNLAHSGATIGIGVASGQAAINGEIPIAHPTILEQVAAFSDRPSDVDLLLINGGINDVGISRIANPLIQRDYLAGRIKVHCYDDMKTLLGAALKKFPNARVIVTGYHPILSPRSEPVRIPNFLNLHGIGLPSFLSFIPIVGKVVSTCMQFWQESNGYLAQAAMEAGAGNGRVTFVPSPFTEANAVFADDPWLFGISSNFNPQDEVAADRHEVCEVQFGEIEEILSLEQCFRASAGHPNVKGAAAIAGAIIAAL